ncbi:uncharacterized protein LOC144093686 isoform X3 [Amblyomma americanum]
MNVAGITAPFSSMSQLVRSSQSLRSHRDTAFGSFEEFLGAPTSEPPLSGHQTAFAVVVTTVRIVSDATLSTVASSHGSGKHEGSAATLAPPSTSSSSVCFRTVTLVWPLVLLGGAAAAVITLVPVLFLGNVMASPRLPKGLCHWCLLAGIRDPCGRPRDRPSGAQEETPEIA